MTALVGLAPAAMEQAVLEALVRSGGRLTRAALWAQLGLADAQPTPEYWAAENALYDAGRIERRRGRGGGIYLRPTVDALEAKDAVEEPSAIDRPERDHYPALVEQIPSFWLGFQGIKHVFAHTNAHQGRRETGGRWSRPDMVVCTVSEWLFSSRPDGEVRTIEVKLFCNLDATAVYEALAHRMRSHYGYVLAVDTPATPSEDDEKRIDLVRSHAERHGIGLILARTTEDATTWELAVDARRSDSDHAQINEFLVNYLDQATREQFIDALRSIRVRL